MRNHTAHFYQSGVALVTLLIFIATTLIITSAAVVITVTNAQATSVFSLAEETFSLAETGADNALLRLLRNPNYTGETLTIGSGSTVITVTGTTTKTIRSQATKSGIIRAVEVIATYTNGELDISSWREVN